LKGLGNTAKPKPSRHYATMGVGGMTFFLLIALASGITFIKSVVEKN
jgi:hypothetical protein